MSTKYFWSLSYNHWGVLGSLSYPIPNFKKMVCPKNLLMGPCVNDYGSSLKNLTFKQGVTKNQKGTWIVSWFKGRLGKKEGGGGFKVGRLRTQCTLCITWQNNSFLLELIDHILLISEYVLEKTLVAFDLDEKLPQTIAQIK